MIYKFKYSLPDNKLFHKTKYIFQQKTIHLDKFMLYNIFIVVIQSQTFSFEKVKIKNTLFNFLSIMIYKIKYSLHVILEQRRF